MDNQNNDIESARVLADLFGSMEWDGSEEQIELYEKYQSILDSFDMIDGTAI